MTQPPGSVSVVVPCFNYGWCLRDCVESVLDQADVDVRVLIIDDASTDTSARVAAELSAADARVEVRSHVANRGHIRTFNEGLQWASGTYTVLLSADDLLVPGALQRAGALLEAHPEVGFVYGQALVFHDAGSRPKPATGPVGWTIWPGREWFATRCRATENCVASPTAVVRTRLQQQIGAYREDLPHSADFEMWMRFALHADVGYVGGAHHAYYRAHPTSMSHQRFGTALADLTQVRAAFEVLFQQHGEIIADRQRLEELVRRTLARRALRDACRAYDGGQPNLAEVTGLEALATSTYSDARRLRERYSLRWRQRLGPRLCWTLQPCLLVTVAQRLRRKLQRRRWWRAGL